MSKVGPFAIVSNGGFSALAESQGNPERLLTGVPVVRWESGGSR